MTHYKLCGVAEIEAMVGPGVGAIASMQVGNLQSDNTIPADLCERIEEELILPREFVERGERASKSGHTAPPTKFVRGTTSDQNRSITLERLPNGVGMLTVDFRLRPSESFAGEVIGLLRGFTGIIRAEVVD